MTTHLIVIVVILCQYSVTSFCCHVYTSSRFKNRCHGRFSSKDGDETDDSTFKQLKIAFVTGNQMKVREVNMILTEHGATRGPNPDTSLVQLRVLNVDLPEIQEVSTEAIAKNKAIQGSQLAGGACVVEDTSLHFTALGGMPGPFIKWFQNTLKSEGLYNLLLAYPDKSAEAICTLAFCPYPHADPGAKLLLTIVMERFTFLNNN
jgi:non-canonical purine NTP pyrophosphatase (RdgB/HAM1 family)